MVDGLADELIRKTWQLNKKGRHRMIIKCVCVHEGQDELHGLGNRVANPTTTGTVRCTVCKQEQRAKAEAKAEVKVPKGKDKKLVKRLNLKKLNFLSRTLLSY